MLVGSEIAIYWIIVAVIAIIVLLIYTGIENMGTFDFEDLIDTFFGESGWAFFFGVFLLGGIVFGFLNWIWWAMLLILGIPLIGLIVFIIIIHRDESKQIESSDDEEIIQTNMNCPNCGAKIIKQPFYDDDGNKNYQYKCDHCNTVFSKVDIFSITHPEEKQKIFDLDDWEEEYFEACDGMQFNAHNIHTEKQIKRKYDTLKEFISNGNSLYENVINEDELLDYYYNFFLDNLDEIQEYFNKYSQEEIEKRYNFYSLLEEI